MQWATHSYSFDDKDNGPISLAGIDGGYGYNYYTVPGSQTPGILNITQTTNIGIPGIWMYSLKSKISQLYWS